MDGGHVTCSQETQDIIRVVAAAAYDKLATDPVLIDVSERLLLADAFVIASAPTERQVRAIAENVMDEVATELHLRPERIEGRSDARWMLLDYGDVVVHVLVEEDRAYYALEKLWGDQPAQHLADPSAEADQAHVRAV